MNINFMKTYEAVFDTENEKGIFAISLVENPATQEYFIQLSEDEKEKIKETTIKFKSIDEEQRLLIGLVLEPNKPVYRNQDGEEFNVVFSEDTIKNLSHNFFKQGYQLNSTIEHNEDEDIKGITFCESWTVADPKKDKSNSFGLEYPKGSWMIAMKVDNDEIWQDYVKTGKVKGFSVDGLIKLKEVKNDKKTDIKMTIEEKLTDWKDRFVAQFTKEKKEVEKKQIEIKLGQVNFKDGQVIFEYEGDVLQAGVPVFAVDKEDETLKIPVPVGEYELEDGRMLIVTEEGVVGEVKEKAGEEAPVEEAPVEEAPKEEIEASDDSSAIQDIKSILIKYEDRFKKLEELAEKFETVEKQVLEFSEKPREKPRKTVTVKYSDMNNYQKLKHNREN